MLRRAHGLTCSHWLENLPEPQGRSKKAHSYFLNRLMHIPFDPTQGFHSRRSRKITFVSKEKELRVQKGWRAANVSPIKPAEADRYQWHFPVVTFHSFFFLSAPLPLRPSEGFSIGLLNNADPPSPKTDLYPSWNPSLTLSCFQFISGFRRLSSLETRNNALLHPEECQTPFPPSLPK